jgi:hypothetical protein
MASWMHDPAARTTTRMARPGMPLSAIGTVGLVCGPGTALGQLENLRALGGGWSAAIESWRQSEAAYCFFLARAEDDGSAHAFARPVIFCTSARHELERSVWSIASIECHRAWVLDSLEPTMDEFVAALKGAEAFAPGHA